MDAKGRTRCSSGNGWVLKRVNFPSIRLRSPSRSCASWFLKVGSPYRVVGFCRRSWKTWKCPRMGRKWATPRSGRGWYFGKQTYGCGGAVEPCGVLWTGKRELRGPKRIFRRLLVFPICFLGKNFKRVSKGIKSYQMVSKGIKGYQNFSSLLRVQDGFLCGIA
jgi:hypothetical protein